MSINNRKTVEVLDYGFSDLLKKELGFDVNTRFRYNSFHGKITIYANVTWFQKQRLMFMFGDHFFQRDGNFKWLVSGVTGSIFTICLSLYLADKSEVKKLENQVKLYKIEEIEYTKTIKRLNNQNVRFENLINQMKTKKTTTQ